MKLYFSNCFTFSLDKSRTNTITINPKSPKTNYLSKNLQSLLRTAGISNRFAGCIYIYIENSQRKKSMIKCQLDLSRTGWKSKQWYRFWLSPVLEFFDWIDMLINIRHNCALQENSDLSKTGWKSKQWCRFWLSPVLELFDWIGMLINIRHNCALRENSKNVFCE